MRCYILFGVLCCIHAVVAEKECYIPRPEKDIEWDQLPGNWYQIMNTNDTAEALFGCNYIHDIKPADDGAYYVIEDFGHAVTHTYMSAHLIRQGYSAYIWDTNSDKNAEEDVVDVSKYQETRQKLLKQNLQEIHNFNIRVLVYHTDYVNYLIGFNCGSEGKRYIWVHSHKRYPTAEGIARVRNKLIRIGEGWEEVPLYMSGCTKKEE